MLNIPNMLLIGSSGRNSGKTFLATEVIKNNINSTNIIGLKVTTIKEKDGKCPRGGDGCGVCSSLKGNFMIDEEYISEGRKDTSKLLKSGAKRVLWLRVLEEKLVDGITEVMKIIPNDHAIVTESNRLALVAKPGLFIMVENSNSSIKDSAKRVWKQADSIIKTDGAKFDLNINLINYKNKKWKIEQQ